MSDERRMEFWTVGTPTYPNGRIRFTSAAKAEVLRAEIPGSWVQLHRGDVVVVRYGDLPDTG